MPGNLQRYKDMFMFGSNKIVARLDTMLTDAINGVFTESNYDETQLSRLESKFRQYLTGKEAAGEKVQAERAAIKELVTDISHQTKTPIANICLYTQLLEEASSPETLPLVRQIHQQAEKLEFLIQALTKISRLESHMIQLHPTCQPVCGLVQRSVEEARGRASSRHITIKNTAGDSTIKASFDFKWTQEALGNLLDNAVKYSPEGSLVTVSLQALEMFVSVTVADQGMAVGEEERAQIFERFYRGANARQTEGNGVGLYLTRMILQREGGYIKVSPGKEGGNCFCIYLPKEPLPPAVAPGTQP